MKKPLTYGQKKVLFRILAYLASVGVPVGTCAVVFPPEIVSDTRMSVGATLIITMIVSIAVFRKKLKEAFENYSVIITWAVLFLVSILLEQFCNEMKIISLVGLASNLGAMPLFKLSEANATLADELKKKQVELEAEKGATDETV